MTDKENKFYKYFLKGAFVVNTTDRYNNKLNTLKDILTDLVAFAKVEGIDFDAELEKAKQLIEEEIKDTRWENKEEWDKRELEATTTSKYSLDEIMQLLPLLTPEDKANLLKAI